MNGSGLSVEQSVRGLVRSISGHLSEVKLNIATLTSSNQVKAYCDILPFTRSRTSGSSLLFLTFTRVWAIMLQAAARRNNCSSFTIQLSISHFHLQAWRSLFRNFHWKSTRFNTLGYNAAGFLLDLYFQIKLKSEL